MKIPELKRWERFVHMLSLKLHFWWREKLHVPFPQEKMKRLQMIRPGKSGKELEEWEDCRRFTMLILATAATIILTVVAVAGEQGTSLLKRSGYLERLEPGKGSRKVQLKVRGEGTEKKVSVVIPEREYRPEELKAKMTQGRKYIEKQYLGQNRSAERVEKPLQLVSQITDSAIKVRWQLDASGYVNKDGTLNNGHLKKTVEVSITAVMVYKEVKERVVLEFSLIPRTKSREERFWENWESRLEEEKERSAQQRELVLPREADQKRLRYTEIRHPVWSKLLLLGGILCVCIPFLLDYQIEQGIRKRDLQMQREYPEMVERFILLLGAGLTIRGAWQRITMDYEKRRAKGEIPYHFLYEEMVLTRIDMENGKSEAAAYTAFGRRVSMLQYMKFSTLLVQNLKKGSDDLLRRMEMEASDAVRARRELAKKLGEEAGTRLLLPMMMMLVVVFALIMTAAFRAM